MLVCYKPFARKSYAHISYSREELLNIGSCYSDNFIGELREVAKTAGLANSPLPTGNNHRHIPPDANSKLAMKELHTAISKQQTLLQEAAFIVAGDFNHSNLKSSCPTRGDKTLDHV